MLFDRRTAPTIGERVRVLVWPRRSWDRSLRYVLLRLMRVPATPHQLALGCAIGVFAAITPLVGVQMVLAGVLAVLLKASFAAAMIGTLFGNPAVWAFVWPATYSTGAYLLGMPPGLGDIQISAELARFSDSLFQGSPDMFAAAFGVIWPLWEPMLLGTLPVGLLIAGVFYVVCRRAAELHQQRRIGRTSTTSHWPLGYFVATYDPAQS
ncbi:MAG: DUF2062 domain-containing protein [Pseudomonadota bacterium]